VAAQHETDRERDRNGRHDRELDGAIHPHAKLSPRSAARNARAETSKHDAASLFWQQQITIGQLQPFRPDNVPARPAASRRGRPRRSGSEKLPE
jgi:hypothetical protein